MLEKDIVGKILRFLKALPACFAWKTHGGMYAQTGIPDIIACIAGRFVAFEVKQPGGKLTEIQSATIRRINEAKGIACKVTSVEEVSQIIRQLQEDEPYE